MFTTDTRTETFLTMMGVKWKYSNNIRWADLKPHWESRNIARPVAVREKAVEQYAELYKAGSQPPAPILLQASGSLDVLDGVQRLVMAHLCNATSFSGYCIECDSPKVVLSIRMLANTRLQGHAEKPEWTRRRAVEQLVVSAGLSVQEVAAMGGWRVNDVAAIANNIRLSETIKEIGGPDDLSDVMLAAISDSVEDCDITKASKPISKFLHLLQSSRMSAEDAQPYLDLFFAPVAKESRSFEKYTERLKTIEDMPEIQARVNGRRGVHLSGDVNLRRSLRASLGILEGIVESGEDLVYVDEFFGIVTQLQEKLHRISKRHQKAKTARVPADMYMEGR
jgi:hypothetical protein